MAVTVSTSNNQRDKFDDAVSISVDEQGHLAVRKASTSPGARGKTVAIYAPKTWWKAETD